MIVPAAESATRIFESRAGVLQPTGAEEASEAIRRALAGDERAEGFVWIDIIAPGEREAIFLRDELNMHPLAVEDCLRGRQRPKMDNYPGYSFVVFYATRINPARSRMALNEIHIFLARDFLITVHSHEIPEVEEVIGVCRESPARWNQSTAVAHAILDRITDHYFPLVEHFSNRIVGFEEEVFLEEPTSPLERVGQLRRELIHFRRILGPERDVLSQMVRRELPFVRPELIPYFQDIHDHILRATEEVDTLRELLAGLIEIHASTTGRQLNQTMQTLTAWSIILMTMTLVAGIYGMNFADMPELEWRMGYFAALVAMLGLGMVIGGFFRRKGWL